MNKFNSVFEKIRKNKLTVILLAVIGIILIGISYIPFESSSADSTETEYGRMLEEKTKRIIEAVTGANTTEVMITFENSYIPVSVGNNQPLYHNKDESNYFEMPTPEISGVMIVCTAIDNESDFLTIKQAVATCLDIPKNKIYIIGGKNDNEKNNQQF